MWGNANGNGLGFGTVLFLVLLVLKLTEVIDWSWLWVSAPLWAPIAVLVFVAAPLTALSKGRRS